MLYVVLFSMQSDSSATTYGYILKYYCIIVDFEKFVLWIDILHAGQKNFSYEGAYQPCD